MNKIDYIIGSESILEGMDKVPAWKPFDDRVVDFLDTLSKMISKSGSSKRFPDLVSLAFFLRKGNIKKAALAYADLQDYIGTGMVFHIAPGNIALSFAYSAATGLLAGNTNVIRLPSRAHEQADIFCNLLRQAMEENAEIAERICLIKYPHDKAITDELSGKCHMRVIWGGDDTINTIRQSPIPPRASEITFSNRFSVCIIDADKYLELYNPKKTAHDFYIDTYLTDQNACSSPRIVFWMGQNIDKAKEQFWMALANEIDAYEIAPVTTVNKLLTFCKYSALNKAKMITERDMKILRLEIDGVNKNILENVGNSGFFYECDIESYDEILDICTWQLQTISYIGIDEDELKKYIISKAPQGVDRIVPVGKTLDFGFIWDGKDVIRQMARKIEGKM